MNVELGVLGDGGLIIAGSEPFPHLIKRVEFYRDQKLFMLIYDNEDQDSELMHYEVPKKFLNPVENSPDVIIYSLFKDHEPIGYKVPLIKVGELY